MNDFFPHKLTIHMFVRAAGLDPLDAEYQADFIAPFGPASDQTSLELLLRHLDCFHDDIKRHFPKKFEQLAEAK